MEHLLLTHDRRPTRRTRRCGAVFVFCAFGSAALVAAPLHGQAQARATIPGFNITYAPPAGWQVGAQEGRMHVWVDTDASAGLFVFGGAFSPITLAMADAGTVLEDLPEQEPEMVESLAERQFGSHAGLTATFRARGADGSTVIVRLAAVSLDATTTLGAVAIVPADRHAARSAAFAALEAILGGARAGTPTPDAALTRRITGTWHKQSDYNSGPTGGGFIDEERWTLSEDGRFTRFKTFTVSVPGAAVEPTREEQAGTWRAIGGALVLEGEGETVTISVAPDGQALRIGGARYIRR